MEKRGNLFVISGPSGAGKGTLVASLLNEVPSAWVSVSATTRDPRSGEEDGIHYHFLSDEEFDQLISEDGFLEWAQVHANKYGTPRAQVEECITDGKQVILEIDVQGAFQIKEKMPDAILVFIDPPSLEVLEERLRNRGTETEDVIAARMKVAEVELSHKKKYDCVIVNDNFDEALMKLKDFVESHAAASK